MKKILMLAGTFSLLMLLLFLLLLRGDGAKNSKRNIARYNDMLYRMAEDYRAGADMETLETAYGCTFIPQEKADGLGNPELAELHASGALILDFAPAGEVLGKVAWNDRQEEYAKDQRALLIRGRLIWLGLLLAGNLFLLILYFSILRPEREMERFAGEIARGSLDIPLPMHRHNMFGNLTESFDLMREQLQLSREREAQAEKNKKEMALSLSHDIRTPVTAIRAACEMVELISAKELKEKGDDPNLENIRDKVRIIDAKAETISQLTDNILSVSLKEISHIQVDVKEESSELIAEFLHRLQNYGEIILENDIPARLVYMDRLRMEQVIDNIVGNSRKYAGTAIHVRFTETAPDGEQRFIRIRISDRGPGVPESELPFLTEMYYRGSGTAGKSGAGIGMYLARWYMEKQRGGMEYYNDNGFVVELLVRVV